MASDPLADFDQEILDWLLAAGITPEHVQLSTPPEREFGERATNVAFRLAKERRQPPKQIAEEIATTFRPGSFQFISAVEPAGAGFINIYLNYSAFIPHVIQSIEQMADQYGRREGATPRDIVVEHTSVNPNKEWHVGHLRNAVLGDVVARILSLAGNNVQVQNYIDDTGLQAAMAVVGLLDFPEPETAGEKFDHFSGRSYVKVNAELATEGALHRRLEQLPPDRDETGGGPIDERTSIEARLSNIERLKARAVQVMHALESGQHRQFIHRILDAQLLTAYRLGIFYDLLVWESNLVESRLFERAMERISESPRVFRASEGRYGGAFVIQMGEATGGEEAKAEVLVRSNGLPTYVGKDIAYHLWKFHLIPDRLGYEAYTTQPNGEVLQSTALDGEHRNETPPEAIINIIGVHQAQAQATVKEALRVAGFEEAADELVHLAYGMVMSPEGMLSGRKGTALSADVVIDEAVRTALERVHERRSAQLSELEMDKIGEAVGIGAVRYFMVQHNPLRDIVFKVDDVVSYEGNTGLYVQYALVRMFAILRRAADERGVGEAEISGADAALLEHEQEKRLIYHLALYPGLIADVVRTLGVNLIAEYAYDLSSIFSQFYRDCTVLDADPNVRNARLKLVRAVRDVLTNTCKLLGVPVIERL